MRNWIVRIKFTILLLLSYETCYMSLKFITSTKAIMLCRFYKIESILQLYKSWKYRIHINLEKLFETKPPFQMRFLLFSIIQLFHLSIFPIRRLSTFNSYHLHNLPQRKIIWLPSVFLPHVYIQFFELLQRVHLFSSRSRFSFTSLKLLHRFSATW